MLSIDKCEIPRDPDDVQYVVSFDVPESPFVTSSSSASLPAYLDFFNAFGFVVFRNVFSEDECQLSRNALLESVGLSSLDLSSGSIADAKLVGKYGLTSRGPYFHPHIVNNRQNIRLIAALAAIIETNPEDIIVSHDRGAFYRPTVTGREYSERFSTGDRNLHLDLNPWWWLESNKDVIDGIETLQYRDEQDFIKENNLVVRSMGRHVQCVINLIDNRENDGGTILVPKFHKILSEWCETNRHLRLNVPWLTLPVEASSKNKYLGCKSAFEIHQELLALAVRIPLKEGSVLIWDQTMMHGTAPNHSDKFRMVQYLKAGPRSKTYPPRELPDGSQAPNERLIRRASKLQTALQEFTCEEKIELTDIGKYVFGFDVLGPQLHSS